MDESTVCNWDAHSCQSLLGYGKAVHEGSGCICAYCDLGKAGQDFDMWRQLSVDHVVPTNCIGANDWTIKFPKMSKPAIKKLHAEINKINLVTACNFCNSMTSRMKIGNREAILPKSGYSDAEDIKHPAVQEMLQRLGEQVNDLKEEKRKYVQERLRILELAYAKEVKPKP